MDIKDVEGKKQLMMNELGQLRNQLNQIQARIQQLTGGILLCNEFVLDEEKKAEEETNKAAEAIAEPKDTKPKLVETEAPPKTTQ
jgi:predicted  nucleic acid-binding Zn-ribbon protein